MIKLSDLTQYLNQLLTPAAVQDYCPNGLQVGGRESIQKILTGVSATQALFEKAIEEKADTILVHHGFFWKNESPCVVGVRYKRLHTLLQNNISLIAYHLPLDLHSELGNNVQLGQLLDILLERRFRAMGVEGLGFLGNLKKPISPELFSQQIEAKLDRIPIHIPGNSPQISKVAWCTGAAHGVLEDAITQGADTFITGELSESSVNLARDAGIHLYGAGHHATERYGIKALGEHLAQKYSLDHTFVDIDNPI
jgi:dinuclear metal center YbgI/SA1388 family protein